MKIVVKIISVSLIFIVIDNVSFCNSEGVFDGFWGKWKISAIKNS